MDTTTYRALSLWNPWAALMAVGEKRIETRNWTTSYTGLVAIHATAKSPTVVHNIVSEEPFRTALASYPRRATLPGVDSPRPELPEGRVVAFGWLQFVVRIIDQEHAHRVASGNGATHEIAFGDYSPGRYAWVFRGITRLPEPIPARGGQGFWGWTPREDDRDRVRALIESRSVADWQRR